MRELMIVVTDIREILIENKKLYPDCSKLQKVFWEIDNLYESMHYFAPEHIQTNQPFLQLQDIMNYHINQDDYICINWCKDVIDIFLDPNYGN